MARFEQTSNDAGNSSGMRMPPTRYARIAARCLRWLILLFGVTTLLGALSFIPDYYERLTGQCVLGGCGLSSPAPPTTLALLHEAGLTVSGYAMWFVVLDGAFMLLYGAAAFIILHKGRHEPMALLASAMLIAFGTTFPQLVHAAVEGHAFYAAWFTVVSWIGWLTLFLFFAVFPDGRFAPRWTALPVAVFPLVKLGSVLLPGTQYDHNEWPLLPAVLLFLIPIAALLYSQFYRYRRSLSPEQRQQTKWVIYGLAVGLAAFIAISLLFDPDLYRTPAAFIYLNGALHLFLLVIPFTLCLAILRHRLWDVDPVMNRSLVYLLLTASIAAVYGFTILYLSALFRTGDRFIPSLFATLLVAILFAPLKDRLQRMVDRLLKGRHDDPYGVLADLRSLLVKPLPPEAMLDAVVRFVREALRIPYAAVAIELNGQERIASAASDGTADSGSMSAPIVHRGLKVGVLITASRPGEPFTSEDRRLMDVLLGHAGPIVDNYMMTRGMKLLAEDLQRSREKLVLAREEERRMLRRNLHDELAPRLAALGLNATAAEMNIRRNPEAAIEQLGELRHVIRSTVTDIRALVRDMRPAALDEWGLVGAIQERIRELTVPMQVMDQEGSDAMGVRIAFEVPASLPPLPAAVEVAAYWIVTESIANVVRHAQATLCTVKLAMAGTEQLVIEVIDNGVGVNDREIAFDAGSSGIGIGSLRERAAELGGTCTIERLAPADAPGGTRVQARLPVLATSEQEESL